MKPQSPSIYRQCNIRLDLEEWKELERRAKEAGISVGTFVRNQVLGAIFPVGPERRSLQFVALASEINRLNMVAWQQGEIDLSAAETRARIEREARVSAEAIADRWLGLNNQKGVSNGR